MQTHSATAAALNKLGTMLVKPAGSTAAEVILGEAAVSVVSALLIQGERIALSLERMAAAAETQAAAAVKADARAAANAAVIGDHLARVRAMAEVKQEPTPEEDIYKTMAESIYGKSDDQKPSEG